MNKPIDNKVSLAVDASKEINIKNDTSIPVCIISVNTNPGKGSNNKISIYSKDSILLESTDNSVVLNANEMKTYTLDQTYLDHDTNQEVYATLYELMVSNADTFFPAADLSVLQINEEYAPQTVTSQSLASMKNAGKFIQAITAYPGSKLSIDFNNALSNSTQNAQGAADGTANSAANTIESLASLVNNFFKNTTSYSDVTLSDYISVNNYYQSVPYVWGVNSNTVFYLYSVVGGKTRFTGTLNLTKPTKLNLAENNLGYQCFYCPAVTPDDPSSTQVNTSNRTNLLYQNGIFVNEKKPDDPTFGLKSLFMPKSKFTQKTSDTSIIPVISGNVDGMSVLGFDEPQNLEANDPFLNILIDPKGISQIIQCALQWAGYVVMVGTIFQQVYGIIKFLKHEDASKKPVTKSDFDEAIQEIKESINTQAEQSTTQVSNGTVDTSVLPEDALALAAEQSSNITNEVGGISIRECVSNTDSTITELGKFISDMDDNQMQQLESLASSSNAISSAIDDATPSTMQAVVKEQAIEMQKLNSSVSEFVDTVSNAISEESRETITANQEAVATASEEIQDAQEIEENIVNEEDPDVDPIEDSYL
ncbi:hypothetical protein [Serratia quinivorans]|uniref:hypothetical protein n=1 Tax=Serratia quinivorans TaxID=137545 RepID=UPI00107E7F59|nr:hypothetical protein [Serratia quinivorans]QBX68326.1 hypothetical protein E4343_20050 [Serratia quinivorans]